MRDFSLLLSLGQTFPWQNFVPFPAEKPLEKEHPKKVVSTSVLCIINLWSGLGGRRGT